MHASPETFNCPSCKARFGWKLELANKAVRCECGHQFKAPPASVDKVSDLDKWMNSEDQSTQEAQTKRCPLCHHIVSTKAVVCVTCGGNPQTGQLVSRNKNSLKRDRNSEQQAPAGLKITQAGLLLSLLSAVLVAIGFGLDVATIWNTRLDAWTVIAEWGASGCSFIGAALCLATPKACRGRPILLASLIATVLSAGVGQSIEHGGLAQDDLQLSMWEAGSGVLGFASTICFLMFFVKLADYLEFPEIRERAQKVLTLNVMLAIATVLVFVPFINCVIGFLILGLAIYAAFLYVLLVVDLNRGVACRIREGGV